MSNPVQSKQHFPTDSALVQPSIGTFWPGLRQGFNLGAALLAAPFYRIYQIWLQTQLQHWCVPRHIGIIMDGNRRFARSRKLTSVLDGHSRGADKLEEVLEWCEEAGVEIVTVWIFSMDNFNRDPHEVDGLMELFEKKITELITHPRILANKIKVRFLGKTEELPEAVRNAIQQAERATASHERRVLNVGVAYGGRQEIVDAFREYLLTQAKSGRALDDIAQTLQPDDIAPFLYTSHVPDPDLIIRTSGEVRLSGFLLWQSVYSEYYFCDSNWPAFRKIDFLRAMRSYHQRKRRFGR